jgi:hypothetical protein
MSNPTSNFNWQMPTNTDLVSQLPADFEVFGQAVDTSLADLKGGTTGQVLKKNSNTDMDFVWGADSAGMTNPMTTTGDTIYSSSGSTPARLGIGSTGNVLTVSGGLPVWAAPAGGGASWTLLNAGGTAMSGSSTVSITGITGMNQLKIIFQNSTTASAGVDVICTINNDTTAANYKTAGNMTLAYVPYTPQVFWAYDNGGFGHAAIHVAKTQSGGTPEASGQIEISGANTSNYKIYSVNGGASSNGTANQQRAFNTGGFYDQTATISSIQIKTSSGNFTGGTLYVLGSAI